MKRINISSKKICHHSRFSVPNVIAIYYDLLPRDAMHKCGLCRHAVSVCLSRSWTLSQRINISSKKFCHRIVTPFWFFCTKHYGNIPTVTSPNGVVNAGGVGRNHDSQDLLVYMDRQTKFATACGMLTCSRVSDKMTYIYATVLVGRLL